MKFKIKDIFNLNEEVSEQSQEKETIQEEAVVDESLQRMQKLIESFNEKGAIRKEKSNKKVSEEVLKEESDRNKKLSSHRLIEGGNEGLDQGGMQYGGGYGQTVTSFENNPDYVKKFAKLEKSELTDSEALEVSIKRALKSGNPINNMAFYDEINWNLNQLGFDSKQPLDIKVAIVEIMQFGAIKKDNAS